MYYFIIVLVDKSKACVINLIEFSDLHFKIILVNIMLSPFEIGSVWLLSKSFHLPVSQFSHMYNG